ncbi:RNA-directed DNA polymerase, eukaryota, Reverse transcriptase zinc-binding domain protein [Artemisia annua]|uniref:RNA-directed DNA polymerase, eukaryota, Reverse transcriptase zinc-binding domain protein n=1 Tax=Artemisia annua TaxID=35608 RepID=A0A2U1M119_ARTAN|nr:RNA-directed DNA polymerase, eukaryota, Reverse transcriptase zinc-binding domain protein [Artemisia annua]
MLCICEQKKKQRIAIFGAEEKGKANWLVKYIMKFDWLLHPTRGHWEKKSKNLEICKNLKCFQDASGLAINLAKSCIYGVGLSVGKSMHKSEGWGEVKSCMTNRLSVWKSKLLSIGGRSVLAKAVLGSLPLYYLSLFRAPINVIDSLERMRSRFFWGFKEDEKGMVWISWKNTIASRDMGGLGFGSLRAKNLSLIGKWRWRFLKEKDALWRKVIRNIFGDDGGFTNMDLTGVDGSVTREGLWRGLIKS